MGSGPGFKISGSQVKADQEISAAMVSAFS
jgi:hypothetical protein